MNKTHSVKDDFQHFLSYSGLHEEPEDTKQKLFEAFEAAWDFSPPMNETPQPQAEELAKQITPLQSTDLRVAIRKALTLVPNEEGVAAIPFEQLTDNIHKAVLASFAPMLAQKDADIEHERQATAALGRSFDKLRTQLKDMTDQFLAVSGQLWEARACIAKKDEALRHAARNSAHPDQCIDDALAFTVSRSADELAQMTAALEQIIAEGEAGHKIQMAAKANYSGHFSKMQEIAHKALACRRAHLAKSDSPGAGKEE